jgi:hypothetical protein
MCLLFESSHRVHACYLSPKSNNGNGRVDPLRTQKQTTQEFTEKSSSKFTKQAKGITNHHDEADYTIDDA